MTHLGVKVFGYRLSVRVLVCPAMARPPDRQLLGYLAAYDPHASDLTLAMREVVLEEAPAAIESVVKSDRAGTLETVVAVPAS